jgi:uncharacterized protein (DUF2147 family)
MTSAGGAAHAAGAMTFLLLAVPGAAMAQTPPWAVGTWKGTIERYTADKSGPDRVMVIGKDGKCTWDYAASASKATAASCTISGDTLALQTGAYSRADLRHSGGRLQGTFTTPGAGKTYTVTLTRQ